MIFFSSYNLNISNLNFLEFYDLIKESEDKTIEFKRLSKDKKD